MSTISFFTPVIFDVKTKSMPQKALELVDEYLYLGNKQRHITIFAGEHGQKPSAWYIPQAEQRSWCNTAIKIASYFAVITAL